MLQLTEKERLEEVAFSWQVGTTCVCVCQFHVVECTASIAK